MTYGKISKKQSEILEYMKKEILNRGFPPSVREICQAVHLKSTSSVHAHLETLEKNGYIKRDATKPREEAKYADKMFGGFINGKIMDSAIIGVLCYIGCLIFKFPSALLVSVIIGVTNVIPFFGPFIGAVPATLLILIQNPIKALWFVLFVLVLQQLDGNVIGPKILGNTTGLSSFWVLFAILLFGGLWGFVGMIVGVPLFAVIYDIIKKLVIHGLKRNAELDMLQTYHDNFGDPEDDASPAPEPSAEKQ